MGKLITAGEIARCLGISSTRVHQITHEDASFPAPRQESSLGKLYEEEKVKSWAKRAGRHWF